MPPDNIANIGSMNAEFIPEPLQIIAETLPEPLDSSTNILSGNIYLECEMQNAEALQNKENENILNQNSTHSFAQSFTFPQQYLPKKKHTKLKTEKKLPSVGTSDDWWKIHLQKEKEQQITKEKETVKKIQMEQKKKLAEEKKSFKMNEIAKKIKMEK